MNKILCVFLVSCMLAIGCAGIKNAVCTPNADQAIAYAQELADASQMLVYFQGLAPSVPIQAIVSGIQASIAIIKQAQAGICVDETALTAAKTNVVQTKALEKSLKKSGKSLTIN